MKINIRSLTFLISGITALTLTYIVLNTIRSNSTVTISKMIDNYESHKFQIQDVIQYYKSILPQNTNTRIEFDNSEVVIFHVNRNGSSNYNWSNNKKSIPLDSLIDDMGWTVEELNLLREKLQLANAISIEGKDRIQIGWLRTGLAVYGIEIHPNNLNQHEINVNNDSCTSVFYKDNICFTFESGVIGPQCFFGLNDD